MGRWRELLMFWTPTRTLGLTVAGKGVVSFPGVAEEPTLPRAHGRLCKAFPLDLPMGVGDLYEERPKDVTPFEHAQHLLRLSTGHCVSSARQHRLVWALVNGVLLSEASGKGYAVHRVLLRRLG